MDRSYGGGIGTVVIASGDAGADGVDRGDGGFEREWQANYGWGEWG